MCGLSSDINLTLKIQEEKVVQFLGVVIQG